MQPKTKKANDPLEALTNIQESQSAGGVLEAQPKNDGKGAQTAPKAVEPPKRTINPEEEQKKWSGRFETAKTYQLPLFQKWSKWYDDMYAHVTNQQMAPWRSKVYMPIISSKVWDLISRFIQYRPGWDVTIRTLPVNTLSKEAYDLYMDDMNKKIEKVKMKLDYDYDNPLMEDPIQDELLGVMLDACVTGQGVGRAPYLSRKTAYKSYLNGDTGMDYSKVKVDTATEGYNAFTGVNIFNFFLKPGAKSLQKSPWIVIADQVPVYELQRDPKIDQAALKTLKTGAITNEFAQFEASRNRLITIQDANSVDTTTQMAQIYECWDKEFNETIIYGVGDKGWVELYRGENVYWHRKYPLVPFYIRRKPYQFWGESIFENSESLQSAVNDIFNHYMDSHNMADGMVAIEEGSVVEPYVIEPGGEIRYRGEMPKQFKFPSPDASGVQTALNLINGAIENATISQYASGVPNSSTDQTQGTATGVTRMMEAAAEKVGFMRSNFRRSWREVGQMWLSNTQQFMRTDVVHTTTVKGEKQNEVLRPEDMLGIFGVKVDDGSFEPVSKDQKKQDFVMFKDFALGLQNASVAQAERTQDPNQALNLDFADFFQRGAEHFGEVAGNFIVPTADIHPQTPTAPTEETAPGDPNAPIPEEVMSAAADAAAQPMSAEEAGAVQADGKAMPTSFPLRSVNSPVLG
jgi:hypothetical protein